MMETIINNRLFNNIEPSSLKKILNDIQYVTYSYTKDEIIKNEREECKWLGLIVEGSIELQRIYSSGRYIVLKKLDKGDIFGEALIFSDNNCYPATVVAASDCRIIFINKGEIIRLCKENETILQNFISLLSNKVFMLNNKIKNQNLKSIRDKVVNYILENRQDYCVYLNESKETIANELGVPRPSFSIELINLKEEGYIDYDRHIIKILDIEALEEISER